MLPPRRRAYFQGSEPAKKDQKSMPKRAQKKHRKKTSQKSILPSVLASQNPPKIDPTSKKIEKSRLRKQAQKKQPWDLPDLTGNQKKPRILRPRRTIQPSFQ